MKFLDESIKTDAKNSSLLQTQPATIHELDEQRRAAKSFDLLVESRQQEIFEQSLKVSMTRPHGVINL